MQTVNGLYSGLLLDPDLARGPSLMQCGVVQIMLLQMETELGAHRWQQGVLGQVSCSQSAHYLAELLMGA